MAVAHTLADFWQTQQEISEEGLRAIACSLPQSAPLIHALNHQAISAFLSVGLEARLAKLDANANEPISILILKTFTHRALQAALKSIANQREELEALAVSLLKDAETLGGISGISSNQNGSQNENTVHSSLHRSAVNLVHSMVKEVSPNSQEVHAESSPATPSQLRKRSLTKLRTALLTAHTAHVINSATAPSVSNTNSTVADSSPRRFSGPAKQLLSLPAHACRLHAGIPANHGKGRAEADALSKFIVDGLAAEAAARNTVLLARVFCGWRVVSTLTVAAKEVNRQRRQAIEDTSRRSIATIRAKDMHVSLLRLRFVAGMKANSTFTGAVCESRYNRSLKARFFHLWRSTRDTRLYARFASRLVQNRRSGRVFAACWYRWRHHHQSSRSKQTIQGAVAVLRCRQALKSMTATVTFSRRLDVYIERFRQRRLRLWIDAWQSEVKQVKQLAHTQLDKFRHNRVKQAVLQRLSRFTSRSMNARYTAQQMFRHHCAVAAKQLMKSWHKRAKESHKKYKAQKDYYWGGFLIRPIFKAWAEETEVENKFSPRSLRAKQGGLLGILRGTNVTLDGSPHGSQSISPQQRSSYKSLQLGNHYGKNGAGVREASMERKGAGTPNTPTTGIRHFGTPSLQQLANSPLHGYKEEALSSPFSAAQHTPFYKADGTVQRDIKDNGKTQSDSIQKISEKNFNVESISGQLHLWSKEGTIPEHSLQEMCSFISDVTPMLASLSLQRNWLVAHGCSRVAEALSSHPSGPVQLARLNIAFNAASDSGAKQLLEACKVSRLTDVDLSGNALSQKIVPVISSNLLSNVSILNLAGNRLGDEGIRQLATSLGDNCRSPSPANSSRTSVGIHLRTLNLSDNAIGPLGCEALAVELLRNEPLLNTLEQLEMSHNRVLCAGAAALAECLVSAGNRRGLVFLGLSHSGVKAAGAKSLLRVILRGTTTKGAMHPQLRVSLVGCQLSASETRQLNHEALILEA